MSSKDREEKLVNKEVTYTVFKDGQFYIIENVPARVEVDIGKQYLPSKTVERGKVC